MVTGRKKHVWVLIPSSAYVECADGLAEQTEENGVSLREYQYSSIMDYGGRWYSDLQVWVSMTERHLLRLRQQS